MTVTLPDLVQPLKWDGNDFESGIERAITKGSALGTTFGNLASSAISGAFRLAGEGLQFIGNQAQIAFADLMEVQDVQAQLNSVLQSTGGIAGVTAEQANSLADAFELTTKFSAEQTLAGENLLLTFTNIGADVFPQATETMLDMSQALGQDMKSSAVQLGKALQDPILGVTALRRVGVNFNEEQEDMIKKMVETGDVAGAQAFILKELQTEFGGSAVAAGQTFGGQLEILNNKIGAVRESIFAGLMPVAQDLVDKFSTWLSSPEFQAGLDNFTSWITDKAVPWIETKLMPALDDIMKWFQNPEVDWSTLWQTLSDGIDNLDWTGWGDKFGEWVSEALHTGANAGVEGASLLDVFGELITGLGEFVAHTIATTFNIQVSNSFQEAIEQWKGFFRRFATWLRNWSGGILGNNLGQGGLGGDAFPEQILSSYTPKKHAGGGVVPAGYPNDTYPALLTSGETIIPANSSAKPSGDMSDASMRKLSKMLALELAKAVR